MLRKGHQTLFSKSFGALYRRQTLKGGFSEYLVSIVTTISTKVCKDEPLYIVGRGVSVADLSEICTEVKKRGITY